MTSSLAEIKADAETRMHKCIEVLKQELMKLRTGRASAQLLDHLRVDYYGTAVPISQVANVTVADARTITVQPWEKPMVSAVEKAIMTSDLGLTPNTAGQVIRIVIPPLTEERRRDLAKVVSHEGENTKVAIRNVRRDANHHCKELLKAKIATEDEDRRAEDDIQKLTDRFVKEVDAVVKHKEDELMQL
ncbi:MAG: ribosome recycling factor [Lysobacterales bacterium]